MKKRGPPATIHRNHLAMTCAALPFFSACRVWGTAQECCLLPKALLPLASLCLDTSPRAPAGRLSSGHITHFPDSQRHSLGWIWGWCYPPASCCWLICCLAVPGSAADVGRPESGKTNGGDADPWSEPGPANTVRQCRPGTGGMPFHDSLCPGTGAWHHAGC